MVQGKWFFYTEQLDDVKTVLHSVYGSEPELTDDDFYGFNIVVYDGNEPVCCGRLNHKDDKFIIGRLCTSPQKRGNGFADLALRMLIRKAFDMGAENVSAYAGEKEANYFLRIGFKMMERTENGWLLTKFEDVGGCCKK